jgi:hypothetical protein
MNNDQSASPSTTRARGTAGFAPWASVLTGLLVLITTSTLPALSLPGQWPLAAAGATAATVFVFSELVLAVIVVGLPAALFGLGIFALFVR